MVNEILERDAVILVRTNEVRNKPYIWVTWLSKIISEESQCLYPAWVKTHYKYPTPPPTVQLTSWIIEHGHALQKLTAERVKVGDKVTREAQNAFCVKGYRGADIAGRPDLITISPNNIYGVWDEKTGIVRRSHISQVMLYMLFLPVARFPNIKFEGHLVYEKYKDMDIENDKINETFVEIVDYYIDKLASQNNPNFVPSPKECEYCDIKCGLEETVE